MSRSRVFLAATAAVIVALTSPRSCAAAMYPLAKATLRVVDEAGKPIEGARVAITFSKNRPPGRGWGTKPFAKWGTTDAKGLCSLSAFTNPLISYGAGKEGYYRGGQQYEFKKKGIGVWLPWNPTLEVVLREKRKPIPMYARTIRSYVPVVGKPFGLDLKAGDWVAPYGKGKVADLVFTMTRRYQRREDFEITLEIAFSNTGDGMQELDTTSVKGTVFRHDYEAPKTGYRAHWTEKVGRTPDGGPYSTERQEDKYLVFRVRTELAADGSIKRALYGKIPGDIHIAGYDRDKPGLLFDYCLNPFGTRGLEFDPERNMFKKLGPGEGVNRP